MSAGVIDYDNTATPELIAGDFPQISDEVTLLEGQVYLAGSVLAEITADGANKGKFVLSDPAAVDGAEKILAVLTYEVDATDADQTADVTLTGEFNAKALVFKAAGWTAATAKAHLRAAGRSIFIRRVQGL